MSTALIAVAMTTLACARPAEIPSAHQPPASASASAESRAAASDCTPADGSVAWSEPRFEHQVTSVVTFDSRGVKRNTWTTPMNPAVLGGDAPPSWLPALLEGLSVRNNAAFESSPIEDDLRHLTPFENFPAHQIAYSMNNRVTADFVVSCQGGEVRGSILTWSGGGSGRMRCSDLPYDPGMAALAPFCADPVDTAAIAEPLLLDLRPPPSDSGGVLGPDDIGVN